MGWIEIVHILLVVAKQTWVTVARSLASQPPFPFHKSANYATHDWERGSYCVEFRDRLRIFTPVLPLRNGSLG